ncbi:conserved Plasmodium protein, unknown function [Plasmodium knowlesi strain H]|uniref:Uncharacterized protein n=3 Tax=Plasmodium knowlesi TaxID=5850 RepID=A0A5K1UQB7_PLAKH|nr:conserved Plasmodium protein, unknown function [Plasmodium knowlesi strain H]OTN66320.1 Uncharacterized protein PKNOH_S09533900 [Plasmodium knowlesi]CAA9989968.1 conserved Plasmodium protein, unknown function [Plasmodium knowlesi strain H]SBO24553.1 conserved Plasmodium protein, unknown function [Plasmodium knowlesi strain H]SBO26350.1 conserved Plasmodium protein, unknown function [Plasmodium knowlesi strain H]VVS79442.1 conserved Plasmodium protein, unknown function [Plasmodium knowlesi s|eukprot:XP_002259983.1 hypothetical protein, conserved in Plasmodium species [Plasmodium knowlesi strain H]
MDKLYGNYDKVFEKYKNNNLYKRKNEKEEVEQGSKKEAKEKKAPEKKVTEKKVTEKKVTERMVPEKKAPEKKTKKVNNSLSSESPQGLLSHQENATQGILPDCAPKGKKNNEKVGNRRGNSVSTSQVNNNMNCSISPNLNPNRHSVPSNHTNRDTHPRERSVNEYKIRKKVSIEINQKIYSDSEKTHFDDKAFLKNNFGICENNQNQNMKKKKVKNDDQKARKMLNRKNKTKLFVNLLFVMYYIFFLFHYIIEIQVYQVYNIVINTFTIIIITVLLSYIYFLRTRNKTLKKIIFYITTYINLLYCLHIYNTFTYWLNIYLNFTMSKRIYLKYQTLFKNISFVFSYFSFDEVFFFLLIFYGLFFLTTSTLTFTLFYYIYNFINYSF